METPMISPSIDSYEHTDEDSDNEILSIHTDELHTNSQIELVYDSRTRLKKISPQEAMENGYLTEHEYHGDFRLMISKMITKMNTFCNKTEFWYGHTDYTDERIKKMHILFNKITVRFSILDQMIKKYTNAYNQILGIYFTFRELYIDGLSITSSLDIYGKRFYKTIEIDDAVTDYCRYNIGNCIGIYKSLNVSKLPSEVDIYETKKEQVYPITNNKYQDLICLKTIIVNYPEPEYVEFDNIARFKDINDFGERQMKELELEFIMRNTRI